MGAVQEVLQKNKKYFHGHYSTRLTSKNNRYLQMNEIRCATFNKSIVIYLMLLLYQ